jgi:endo-1,4-beta-xylanase
MFGSAINSTLRSFGNRIGFISAISLLTFLFAGHLGAQTVVTYGFEDGTADGWSSFNGASTPVATNAASHGGSFSLLTTTSSSGAGGPSILVSNVLLPGAKYTITGFVQLTGGEAATNANFTIRRSDPSCSGGTCFDTVGTFQVPVRIRLW